MMTSFWMLSRLLKIRTVLVRFDYSADSSKTRITTGCDRLQNFAYPIALLTALVRHTKVGQTAARVLGSTVAPIILVEDPFRRELNGNLKCRHSSRLETL